jgi:hypothetical protein
MWRPGCSSAEADTLYGDDLAGPVSWSGNRDIGQWADEPAVMEFRLRDARLYSFQFVDDPALTVRESSTPPARYSLEQNYPNPFNAGTVIDFSLHSRSHVTLTIYNLLGRRVRVLFEGALPAGSHTVTWDGTDGDGSPVAGGVYFYELRTERRVETRKMILLK